MTQPQIASFDQEAGRRPVQPDVGRSRRPTPCAVLSHAGRPLRRAAPCPLLANPLTAADLAALIAGPA